MRTRVTTLSRGARGFHTTGGGTVLLEPGASAELDLADHPAHDAWVAAGEVEAEAIGEEEPLVKARSSGRATSRSRDA